MSKLFLTGLVVGARVILLAYCIVGCDEKLLVQDYFYAVVYLVGAICWALVLLRSIRDGN